MLGFYNAIGGIQSLESTGPKEKRANNPPAVDALALCP